MSRQLTQDELDDLEQRRWDALIAADLDTLERLFDDRLVYTHANGQTDSKRTYLDSLGSGAFRYQEIDRSDTRHVLLDGLAVVTGATRTTVSMGDRTSVIDSRYTAVWSDDAGQWRLLVWHATLVSAPIT